MLFVDELKRSREPAKTRARPSRCICAIWCVPRHASRCLDLTEKTRRHHHKKKAAVAYITDEASIQSRRLCEFSIYDFSASYKHVHQSRLTIISCQFILFCLFTAIQLATEQAWKISTGYHLAFAAILIKTIPVATGRSNIELFAIPIPNPNQETRNLSTRATISTKVVLL